MPIKIYVDDNSKAEVAWLCDDNWDLAGQVSALKAWAELPVGLDLRWNTA